MTVLLNFETNYSELEDFKITSFYSDIKLYLSEEDIDEDEPSKIGYFLAYRFNLIDYTKRDLIVLADCQNGDLYHCADFFLDNPEIFLTSKYLFYIFRILIDPSQRGYGYGLETLGIFLELFAQEEAVSCHPSPTHDLKNKYSKTKGRLLMQKYWSKIGLDYYDEKQNMLWTDNWYMPQWLEKKIFSY